MPWNSLRIPEKYFEQRAIFNNVPQSKIEGSHDWPLWAEFEVKLQGFSDCSDLL
jgi:hypothetical protein